LAGEIGSDELTKSVSSNEFSTFWRNDCAQTVFSQLSTPMYQDRRTSPRQVVNCRGSIVRDASAGSQDCLIADMSDGGVRLFVQAEVPETFVLVIKDGSGASRECRVVWRLDDEIGAEFI
jgi:hypothetical protein